MSNIFKMINSENIFKIIDQEEESDVKNDMNVFCFISEEDEIERRILYPKYFKKFIFNKLNDLRYEIKNIINEMNEIIHKYPYNILFGRINLISNDNISNNVDCDFIEGFQS